ncbi:ADP-heptose:LPS heptosyltransferase [Flavobacterium sp. PL11]|jgi:ADP-heptose:LPS heptosyltransferase|uniref:glycosyltransferase family 9 protein n=1 Tax=Flavobacterium sp. PL11 TaxID=3071717 RepID=UPI002E051AE9|nr:ADP-heptose:LPS heptosyltransferase [Flavobacterium sp. PL11]
MKILVIQQKMIGDVLASSIICSNVKLIYPKCQVDYLVYPFTVPVLENNPDVDNILLFEENYRKSKRDFFHFLLGIKKQKYDIVIDAYGKLESNLVVAFSAAKIRIGFYKFYTKYIYTETVKEISLPLTNAGSAIENRLNLLSSLRKDTKLINKPKIFLTAQEIENGKAVLKQKNIDFSKNIYMISVLGSGENKTYPYNYMATVLNEIVKETQATLLFNYMPNQEKEARKIFNFCSIETKAAINLDVVPTDIRSFLSLMYHCDALIGNEGGAINMAKAINKPTFTIFSTWIIKEAWNSFENKTTNISVHLKDFKPELYGNKSAKEMKNEAEKLYQSFVPELILPRLKEFVRKN